MKLQFALLLAFGLVACTDTSVQASAVQAAGCAAHVVDGRLTVHVVVAEAGG